MSVLAVRSLVQGLRRRARRQRGQLRRSGEGEFLAMIGPNGAGKSTCFNMINGQLAPDSGEILFDGQEHRRACAARDLAARRRAHLSGRRHLRLDDGRRERADGADLARRRDLPAVARRPPRCIARARSNCSTQVGMREAADRPSRELAYGDVKRVELAIALANEPRLLLMDEPTAGMARARTPRAHRTGQAAGGRAQNLGAVHRAFDGRGVRLRRPHHRAGARPADRRRRRRRDPRQCAGARGLFRHRQDFRARSRAMSGPCSRSKI